MDTILAPGEKAFPVIDDSAGDAMRALIADAQESGDSIGGTVACCAVGLPAGLGSHPFGGVENRVSQTMFAIPAVRGIAFGAGFGAAAMRGSQHNDAYTVVDNEITTETNHHGGVLGGMTTGMPLLLEVAFKPTPSIQQPQQTVRLSTKAVETITVSGRHDPCVVPRAVPCVEAAVAIALLDLLLDGKGY